MKQFLFYLCLVLLNLSSAVSAESIIINDIHELQVTDATRFQLNGKDITQILFEQVGTGRRARIEVAGEGSGFEGDLLLVNLIDLAIGPISSTSPLMVMQQSIIPNPDTVLVNIPDNDISQLQVGDEVLVSGRYEQGGNAIYITRIEWVEAGISPWLLMADVAASDQSMIQLGNQVLSIDALTDTNCIPFPPSIGEPVLAVFPSISPYISDQELGPIDSLICELSDPPAVSNHYTGPIVEFNADRTLMIISYANGMLSIIINEDTEIIGGTIDDLEPADNVDVVGIENGDGTVTAISIMKFDGDTPPPLSLSQLTGPVSAISPVHVLGQELLVSEQSELIGIPGDDINNLQLGDIVDVFGVLGDLDGTFEVTRIELGAPASPNGSDNWIVEGPVTLESGNQWRIGDQLFNADMDTFFVCGTPQAGDVVVIVADPEFPYTAAMPLNSIILVRCANPGVGDGGQGLVFFDGAISAIDAANLIITVDQRDVQIFPVQTIINGTFEDFEIGLTVDVFGLDIGSDLPVEASEITIHRNTFRIQGPLDPSDIVLGTSIKVLGQTLLLNDATIDNQNIGSAGLSEPKQVEVSSYVASDGALYVSSMTAQGPANPENVSIIGVANSIMMPDFKMADILVNTDSSQLFLNGALVTQSEFFEIFSANSPVQLLITGASYDSITQTVDGGSISGLQNQPLLSKIYVPASTKVSSSVSTGEGTVTRIKLNEIFTSDFEN